MAKKKVYYVEKTDQPVKIDGNWDKPQWQEIEAIEINNYMGAVSEFKPSTKARMMYDEQNLYVIFHVEDCFVRCTEKNYNGPVYEDSAVELFFSPDVSNPDKYFNLEINCGGTPLMQYHVVPRKKFTVLEVDDLKKIEIAHSLPSVVDPEIKEPVKWTVEYRIPISMLEKYSSVTYPGEGVSWQANFYKIAEKGSNPHFVTWSFVDHPEPDFHLPEFFGTIKFQ